MLAALRIRLKGSADKSLEEMLEAADGSASATFEEKEAEVQRKREASLDDLLNQEPKPKRDWPT